MSKCPLLEVKPTKFAMRRPTAYSQKRSIGDLTRSAAIRPKRSLEFRRSLAASDPKPKSASESLLAAYRPERSNRARSFSDRY